MRLRLRFGTDVKRDAQIPLLRPDFLNGHDAGEGGLVFEVLIGADDTLEVLVGEEALGAFAGDFVHRVDEEDFAAPGLGLLRAADDDAGFHGRVVEEVRTEPEDAFDEIGFDELAAHVRLLLSEEDAVRPEDGAPAGLGLEALQDVLLEGVVGAALRRNAEDIAAPGVAGKGFAVPLLDGVGRIGQHDIESLEPVAFDELRLGQGVAALDAEVLNAVEETVHPGDGGGHQISLLAVELHIPPFLLLIPQVGDAGEQHAAGAAGGVIDGLAGLHVEHLGHEVNDGAVRVELGGGVAGVVGELLDEILVALAQLVLRQIGDGEFERGEVLDEVAQHGIGQAVLVRPLRIAKDAEELVGVGGLDGPHGLLQAPAHIPADLPNLPPMRIQRHLEAVVLREQRKVLIPARLPQRGDSLLLEDIAEPLVEQQREDELLVVARINRPPKEHRGTPEVGFELLLGDAGHGERNTELNTELNMVGIGV